MEDSKLKSLIKEYLKEAKLMQLATSIDGQPWVCSVWFAADEKFCIYWFSSTTRRHSEEVLKNNKVAGAIVLPHTPSDVARGLQFQGTAEVLSDQKDIDKAISVYKDRIFSIEQINEFMSHKNRPHKFYRIKPNQFVLFDVANYPENSRRELNL